MNQLRGSSATFRFALRGFRSAAVCCFVITLLSAVVWAQTSGNGVGSAVDVDGKSWSGTLKAFSGERLTLAVGQETRQFNTSDLLKLQFRGRRSPSFPRGSVLFLDNGDRLVTVPTDMNHESLVADWREFPAWAAVRVPLSTIRGMVLHMPETRSARDRLSSSLLDRRENSDTLFLNNGDRLSGELLGLDRTSLTLESSVGKTTIQRSGVGAVALNSELISFPRISGKRVLIALRDGSRLTARNLRLASEGLLVFDALFGAKLELPLSAVVSLRFLGGRAVYLSDLKPAEYKFSPYLSVRWPLKNDHNVQGGPLRLRGIEYAKGLGVHSKSSVSYELNGQYTKFQAIVGIDDTTRSQGSVTFAVDVDRKRVFTSELLSGKSPALPLGPIDLTGAKRLTLLVDYGQLADIQDYADWCEAVLIK